MGSYEDTLASMANPSLHAQADRRLGMNQDHGRTSPGVTILIKTSGAGGSFKPCWRLSPEQDANQLGLARRGGLLEESPQVGACRVAADAQPVGEIVAAATRVSAAERPNTCWRSSATGAGVRSGPVMNTNAATPSGAIKLLRCPAGVTSTRSGDRPDGRPRSTSPPAPVPRSVNLAFLCICGASGFETVRLDDGAVLARDEAEVFSEHTPARVSHAHLDHTPLSARRVVGHASSDRDA